MNVVSPDVISVSGGPLAPSEVRNALANELADELDAATLDTLRLLTSEVVTNSVVHGGVGPDGWVSAALIRDGGRVRVEIRDSGSQIPPLPRAPDTTGGGGFGLFVVEQLASRWGVDDVAGVCVWFELDV